MRRIILVGMFVLASFLLIEIKSVNAQTQQITITRELRIGFDSASKTWAYNWTVKVKCAGRPPKEFDLTIEEYLEDYSEAVDAAIAAGKAKETFSSRTKKDGTTITEMMKVSTTYQGKCEMP